MKILILNPPTDGERFSKDGRCQSEENAWLDVFPPTTLASVAGALRNKYDIKLLDCIGSKISPEKCLNIVNDFNPDFTIINTATPTIYSDMKIAKKIKDVSDSKIIVYGEHVTFNYKWILKNYSQIDYVIIGEPETPIINILKGRLKSKGIASKNWYGGIWREPNLDDLPLPAYDLLPSYKFPLTGEKWMFVRSGRGCPFDCMFCVVSRLYGKKVRYHSTEYMIKQFKWLVNNLGIRVWMLWDDFATFDKDRMKRLCELIIKNKLNKKIKWFCTTRVDYFDEDLAKIMKMAGCEMISFGFESGSQKVLNKIDKKISLEQSKKTVKNAKKFGIKVIGHFVLGLPGSTPETEKETINFAKRIGVDFAQFYIATPFIGTELYKIAKNNNWLLENNWSKVEQGTTNLSYPNFSFKEISDLKKKAYLSFYFDIKRIKSLIELSSFKQMLLLPKNIFKFMKWIKR